MNRKMSLACEPLVVHFMPIRSDTCDFTTTRQCDQASQPPVVDNTASTET